MSPLLALASDPTDLRFLAYVAFLALIAFFLALDLGVFHREAREVSFRESIVWSVIWIIAALAFMWLIDAAYDHHWLGLGLRVPVLGQAGVVSDVEGSLAAREYLTGYIVERALAMDNIFVIALVFEFLRIPTRFQHRVLFWGIVGAVIMRGLMIFAGAGLVASYSWVIYVFAVILILTAIKMAFSDSEGSDPRDSFVVKLLKHILPVTDELHGQRFLVRQSGRLFATPLLVSLVIVELSDLIFAVDSIPAIFAITADPFILFTSNIFAILGLRALYFCLAALLKRFRFLKPALVVVLLFVGVKMLLIHTPYTVDTNTSMVVVIGILVIGGIASAVAPEQKR